MGAADGTGAAAEPDVDGEAKAEDGPWDTGRPLAPEEREGVQAATHEPTRSPAASGTANDR